MNKNHTQTGRFTNIGLPSLMVVFFTLCFTTFALLALSTAKNDLALSEKMASHKTDYFMASSKAEEILNEIDRLLEEAPDSLTDLDTLTIQGTTVTLEQNGDFLLFSYSIPLENTQTLSVKIQQTNPATAQTYYDILCWQVI